MATKYWIKAGKIVVNGSGQPIRCETCPCPGGIATDCCPTHSIAATLDAVMDMRRYNAGGVLQETQNWWTGTIIYDSGDAQWERENIAGEAITIDGVKDDFSYGIVGAAHDFTAGAWQHHVSLGMKCCNVIGTGPVLFVLISEDGTLPSICAALTAVQFASPTCSPFEVAAVDAYRYFVPPHVYENTSGVSQTITYPSHGLTFTLAAGDYLTLGFDVLE